MRSFFGRRGQNDNDKREFVTRHEAFRVLRTNLEVALADLERPTVLVTSANPGEGKTSTSAQVAHAMAMSGRRVVVVDCDLRHPDVHNWLGGENVRGVAEVLTDQCTLEDALQYLTISSVSRRSRRALYLLSAGRPVDNPVELLGTVRMHRLLEGLSAQADIVLIDTPPVLPVADTLVLGRMAAGAILVIETRLTPVDAVLSAKDALVRNHTRLLGLVVNKLQARDAGFGYGYGYGYGYGSGRDDEGVPEPEPVAPQPAPPAPA